MEQRKNRKAEPHYYSDKLKQKLAKIRFASTTIVELHQVMARLQSFLLRSGASVAIPR